MEGMIQKSRAFTFTNVVERRNCEEEVVHNSGSKRPGLARMHRAYTPPARQEAQRGKGRGQRAKRRRRAAAREAAVVGSASEQQMSGEEEVVGVVVP